MRAARIEAPGEVRILDLPEPVPGPGETVLAVEAAAVCATDRKLAARGSDPPRVPGHELVVRRADGRLSGVHPEVGCGVCAACRDGWENRCPDRVSVGIGRDGGLAESIAVPEDRLVDLDGLNAATGALLEPLACVVHAATVAGDPADVPVAVVGAGTMGVLTGWLLQHHGCRVTLVQRSLQRRRMAAALGLDAVGPEDDAAALAAPPRATFVTAPGADALAWGLEYTAVGGVVQAFAGTPGGAPVDANPVHYRHLTLVGSTGSRITDYRRARDLARDAAVPLDRLPRRVVDLDEAPAAITSAPPSTALKTVVAVGGGSHDPSYDTRREE